MRQTLPALALGLIVLACGLPADVSDEFTVEMDDDVLIITLGDTVGLGALVFRDGRPAPEIGVVYASSDPTVADVTTGGVVRGVSVGQTEVTARALGVETPEAATRLVRVLRSVAIESVTPTVTESPDGRTVSWGEVVEIVGVGLDPTALNVIFVSDIPAQVQSFVPAPADDETASDTLRIWIPARVPEQSSILLSRRGGSTAAWPLNVVQEDLLEPNDFTRPTLTVPSGGLDLRGLALEVRPWPSNQFDCWGVFLTEREGCWSDGYLADFASNDVTVVLSLPEGSFETVPISFEMTDNGETPLSWVLQQNFSLCNDYRGTGFISPVIDHPFETVADSLVVALADVQGPLGVHVTLYGEPIDGVAPPTGNAETAAYDLRILPEYRTAFPADPYEENDVCHLAPMLPWPQGTLDLNWDHGRDLDWFSFTVPGPPVTPSAVVIESEPNQTLATADTIQIGDLVQGTIQTTNGVDYFAFEASAGDWLDLEIRADRTEQSSLNSVIQLFYEGEQIALNNDISNTTFDSRITTRAPGTGWYTVAVQDINGRGNVNSVYELYVRRLDPTFPSVFLDAFPTGSPAPGDFRPYIQVWQDLRSTDGEVQLLIENPDTVSTVLLPGPYLVLVYNKAATPQEYGLTLQSRPIG